MEENAPTSDAQPTGNDVSDAIELHIAAAVDLPALVCIQREVQRLHASWYPALYKSSTDEELLRAVQDFLGAEHVTVVIAAKRGVAAGFVVLRMDELPETAFCFARKEAVVDQISVLSRFQRLGIGRALMAEAIRLAQTQGCDEIRLSVLAANEAAKQFYNELGFVAFMQRMRRPLR